MSRVRFLGAAYDPRPGKEGTVYGPGHETDFDTDDYEYVMALRMRGLAEITDPTGLPAAAAEGIVQEPFTPAPAA